MLSSVALHASVYLGFTIIIEMIRRFRFSVFSLEYHLQSQTPALLGLYGKSLSTSKESMGNAQTGHKVIPFKRSLWMGVSIKIP